MTTALAPALGVAPGLSPAQFQTLADTGPLDVGVFKDRRAALGWLRHEGA